MGAARHHGQRLLPGIVGTAMWDLMDEKLGKFMGNEKGETLQQMSQLIALGRVLSASSDRRETAASLAGALPDRRLPRATGAALLVTGRGPIVLWVCLSRFRASSWGRPPRRGGEADL